MQLTEQGYRKLSGVGYRNGKGMRTTAFGPLPCVLDLDWIVKVARRTQKMSGQC
jgi:hypothetical protein